MIRDRLLIGIVATMFVSTASANDYSGTQAEQDACTPDVFRLCQSYIPDEAPIVACLKVNRAQLSPACHQVFFPVSDSSSRHKRQHHRQSES